MSLIKKLLCRHEYITITNIYGDMINYFGGDRSMQKCIHCQKIKFNPHLDITCKEVNNFNI